jgi:DNA-3-methyladenine glycosylase I
MMTTCCDDCNFHPEDTFNRTDHDTQYGFPLKKDDLLFERLVLEINQAGLSCITILKKADTFDKLDGDVMERTRASTTTLMDRIDS